ncbi:MAG: 5-formyltetrahydrofolate cyclo-ligase [Coriobacteriales bacterium]|nr:5-formyltetrahydrofolate cyclo-ligase [Coriobacteriales bacterium]
MNKTQIRKKLINRRKLIPLESRIIQERFVCSRLEELISSKPRYKIAVYSALRDELNIEKFYKKLNPLQVFFPVLIGKDMLFYNTKDFEAPFVEDPIRKYSTEDFEEHDLCQPQDFTHVIVPLVAFDNQNNRLGYGGGYYDRFLKQVKPSCQIYGVAFKEQLIELVPVKKHDIALPKIIYMP